MFTQRKQTYEYVDVCEPAMPRGRQQQYSDADAGSWCVVIVPIHVTWLKIVINVVLIGGGGRHPTWKA